MIDPSKKKTIILFFPDPKAEDIKWQRMPFSVLAISSLLVEKGHDVKILDERFEKDVDKKIASLLPNALCVGISAFTGKQIESGIRVAGMVKEKGHSLPIVWGGWHPSIFPEQTASDPNVDIVVCGQGERTFLELVEALSDGAPIDKIQGLCFKAGGKTVKTPPRKSENINNFPSLPLNLIDIRNYIGPHMGLDGARTLSYISSQGCPNRCGFCADNMVYKRRWFGLIPERVVGDITELVKKYDVEAIFFEDSNFFADIRRVEAICEGIIKNALKIRWEAMGHAGQLAGQDDNFWKLLRESGCSRLLIGAESGDQEILDLIAKNSRVEDAILLVKKAKKYNIVPILSTMVGFPRSTQRDFKKTTDLAVRARKICRDAEWKLFLYTPYPATDLYKMAIRHMMKEPGTLSEWSKHTLRNVKTPWINDNFRKKVGNVSFFYFQVAYPSRLIQDKIGRARFGLLIRPIFRIAQLAARIRIAFNCYDMPVEPFIYNVLKGKEWIKFT